MFVNYNDYELLYLINDEGSEQAFNLLLEKYTRFIKMVIKRYIFETDKQNDLNQEGLLVLIRCINTYDERKNASFFSYFYVSLKRRFGNLKKDDYYSENIFLENNTYNYNNTNRMSKVSLSYYKKLAMANLNEKGILYFEDCICAGDPLSTFAKNNDITYYEAKKIKQEVIKKLKKIY